MRVAARAGLGRWAGVAARVVGRVGRWAGVALVVGRVGWAGVAARAAVKAVLRRLG